jgi:Icc-related predicted phosphoesterase
MATSGDVVRIAAMSDVHYSKTSAGALQSVFAQVTEQADLLVLCGDLTDYGLVEEAKVLAKDLTATVKIPIVGVLGNHDFESGLEHEITKVLTDAGVTLLDGDTTEVHGIGFAGVRGFCGGFGRGALGAWGEPIIKQFVHEAVNETLKLETALARLKSEHRIALVHYAPIQETVIGEPEVIFPFLGSSRMEEPLGRYQVTAVFHGHAHKGTVEGKTSGGIPVFNVALPLLREKYPDRPPFWLLELQQASVARSGPHAERRQGGRRATDREGAKLTAL